MKQTQGCGLYFDSHILEIELPNIHGFISTLGNLSVREIPVLIAEEIDMRRNIKEVLIVKTRSASHLPHQGHFKKPAQQQT